MTQCYVAPSRTQVLAEPHCIFPALETRKMVTRLRLLCNNSTPSYTPGMRRRRSPCILGWSRSAQRSTQVAVGLDPGSPHPSHPHSHTTEDEYLLGRFHVRTWLCSFIGSPKKEISWQNPDLSQHKYSPLPCLLETGLVSQHSPCSRHTVPCTDVSMVSSIQGATLI